MSIWRNLRGSVVTGQEMDGRERNNTVAALSKSDRKVYERDGVAGLLGIKPTTLVARSKKMGIQKENDIRKGSGSLQPCHLVSKF